MEAFRLAFKQQKSTQVMQALLYVIPTIYNNSIVQYIQYNVVTNSKIPLKKYNKQMYLPQLVPKNRFQNSTMQSEPLYRKW